MPLPSETNPLPWKIDEADEFDLCNSTGSLVVFQVSTTDDTEFIIHAANRIIECRDIVRRLAENEEKTLDQWVSIYEDAKELWAKMKKTGNE